MSLDYSYKVRATCQEWWLRSNGAGVEGMNTRLRVYLFTILSVLILSWESHIILPAHALSTNEEFIPTESIRLRIKANSNSALDQAVKIDIRNAVNTEITKWVQHIPNLDQAREVINSRMDELHAIVGQELEKAGKSDSYQVSLQETDFPTKLYGDRLYPAGIYEAVLITVGDGNGDNWWCVLFPPLCFLDFDSGEHVQEHDEEQEEVEVSFFIVEVIMNLWERMTA